MTDSMQANIAPAPARALRVARDGLEAHRGPRRRVVVLGAGMAGLVAALELERQGHEPVVLEARHRVGGRILTLRGFAGDLYAEAGAMRIPRVHELTLAYCRRFGLALRPFVMQCPRAPVYLAGRRSTVAQVERDPRWVPFGLADHERTRTYQELWDEATRDVRERYAKEGHAALVEIAREYDRYSIREFLLDRGFSEDAIELYGLMSFREANMNASVVEQLRESVGRAFEDMQEIAGGMDRLPEACYRQLRRCVRFGAHVTAVVQNGEGVTVHGRTRLGEFSERGDYCVCTLPFGVLRHVDFRPPLSLGKYRAIRELNYNPSTKILVQVRERFWEREGIVGGAATTDLPIRRLVYPSHPPDGGEERGVLLASYTWGQDAARWGAMPDEDRLVLAMRDAAKIHPEIVEAFEGGASYSWYGDQYAVGAFALFKPGQETTLQPDIGAPEGRVHFAGEHCSLWHAWIEGALESGIAAAQAVHRQAIVSQAG